MRVEPIFIRISELKRRGWVRPPGTRLPLDCSRHCATLTDLLKAAAPQNLFSPVHPAPYIERLQRVIGLVELNHPDANVALIEKAFALAWKGHYGQLRRSGEPYIEHPLAVAEILAGWGLGVEEITAALGHDLSEDARVTKDTLQAELNARVALLVDGVTELGKEPESELFGARKPSKAQRYEKFLKFGAKDLAIIVIKLADRLHNMRTLQHMPPENQKRIAMETLDIYVPLADMLGMWQVKRELEDLSFRYVEPELFSRIEARRGAILAESEPKMQGIVAEIRRNLAGKRLEVETIRERRSIYEISQRMQERKITLEELSASDVWRVSIVAADRAACYRVLGEVHAQFPPIQPEMRDYIAEPRPNGHQFLHTYVEASGFGRLLVHIRDEAMQRNYIYGAISRGPDWRKGDFIWLNALVASAEEGEVEDLFDLVAAVSRQIVVYTEKGKSLQLPFGSTPLDFALDIHTDVFRYAGKARINGRLASLYQPLRDGDVVFVIKDAAAESKKSPSIKVGWLERLRLPRGKKMVRDHLRALDGVAVIKAASEALNDETRKHHLPAKELLQAELFRQFVSGRIEIKKTEKLDEELLEKIGRGEVAVGKLINDFMKFYREQAAAGERADHFRILAEAEDRPKLMDDFLSPIGDLGMNVSQQAAFQHVDGGKIKAFVFFEVEINSGDVGKIQALQIEAIARGVRGVESITLPSEDEAKKTMLATLTGSKEERRGVLRRLSDLFRKV